jgi:hypothetical protein
LINGKHAEKGLTVPKWVLINWPKIPQMPHKLFAQIDCLSPKVWDFDEKRLHRASVFREKLHHSGKAKSSQEGRVTAIS